MKINSRSKIILLLVLIVVGLIMLFLKNSTVKVPDTKLNNPNQITNQNTDAVPPQPKIILNWNTTTPTIPKSLTVYQVSQSLINEQFINHLIKYFNFSETDKVETSSPKNALWINGTKTLQIDYNNQNISYSDTPPLTPGFNQQSTEAYVDNISSDIFKPFNLELERLQIHYTTLVDQYTQQTKANTATQATATYIQFIDKIQTVSKGYESSPITLTINNTGEVISFNVFSGFTQLTSLNKYPTTTIDNIVNNFNHLIVYFIDGETVSLAATISQQEKVVVDIKSAKLTYYQQGNNPVLYPGVFLNGTIKLKANNQIEANLFIPILDPLSYTDSKISE